MKWQNRLSAFGFGAALLACLCFRPAHALYTLDAVTAYRVADNAFTIDGKPDSLWRSLFALPNGNRVVSFQNYSKLVVLQPEKARNDDPSKYVPNPSAGSATLMAAYDSKALYFFFLIKAPAYANPMALACTPADLWKIDAAEVYVDPSVWSAGSSDYRTYFYPDASGLNYGTSPRTIQVDRPISGRDSRSFYRNRTLGDRFQVRDSLPVGLSVAVSPRTASDTGWVGVEMRIPFWTAATDFSPGVSMFASWGFNRYGDSARTTCDENPVAYRWAKNFLSYDSSDEKPPGWRTGDSTHYDPSHSGDGWGQLYLADKAVRNTCSSGDPKATFEANWDAAYWKNQCAEASTATALPGYPGPDAAVLPGPSRLPPRDLRGRAMGTAPTPGFAQPR